MKLRTRVIGGLLCVFLIAVVLGVFASAAIIRTQAETRELDVLTALDQSVNEVMVDVLVWRYELVSAIIFEQDFTNSLHADHSAYGLWRDSPNSAWIQDDPVIDRLIGELDESNRLMHEATLRLIRNQRSGVINIIFLTQELQNIVLPLTYQTVGNLQALSERYLELVHLQADNVWHFQNDMLMIVILVCIVGLIAFLILSYFTTRSITAPIKYVCGVVSGVTKGSFDFNRKPVTAKDETGVLTGDIYTLVDTIRGITDDLRHFVRVYTEDGDIDYRIDESRYEGGYLELAKGINRFADSNIDDTEILLGVLENINKGEFDIKIKQLPGKKIQVNHAVDTFVKNLADVFGQLKLANDACKTGATPELTPDKFEGGWKLVIQGLADIFNTIDGPLFETMEAMSRLSKGYFDKKVAGDYAGDFLELKNSVNTTIDTLSGYISEMSQALRTVASGNLTESITREYIGEFAAIKDSINNISKTLYKTMRDISAASEQVLSGAKQISASAMDLAAGATRQAGSIQELDASIGMISEKTKQNANNAAKANTLSGLSTKNAKEGNESMRQMLDAMQQIKESSNSISGIIKVIEDIAFQTNLLSLNASVEAARAGEHGQGFAVVAGEVRNLATRSQTAASETSGLIQASISRVDMGSGIAESTADALNVVVKNAGEVSDIINKISLSSKEQEEAVGQMSVGILQISSVVQSNSAASQETAAAAEELNSQAELLRQLVGYFRL